MSTGLDEALLPRYSCNHKCKE